MSTTPEVTVKFKWFILLDKNDGSNCVKWLEDNHITLNQAMFDGIEVNEQTHDIAYKIYVLAPDVYTYITTKYKPISIVENY